MRVKFSQQVARGSCHTHVVSRHVEYLEAATVRLNPCQTGSGHIAGINVRPQVIFGRRILFRVATEPPFVRTFVHNSLSPQRRYGRAVPSMIVACQRLQVLFGRSVDPIGGRRRFFVDWQVGRSIIIAVDRWAAGQHNTRNAQVRRRLEYVVSAERKISVRNLPRRL